MPGNVETEKTDDQKVYDYFLNISGIGAAVSTYIIASARYAARSEIFYDIPLSSVAPVYTLAGIAVDFAQYRNAGYGVTGAATWTAAQLAVTFTIDYGIAAAAGMATGIPVVGTVAPYAGLALAAYVNYEIGNAFHNTSEYFIGINKTENDIQQVVGESPGYIYGEAEDGATHLEAIVTYADGRPNGFPGSALSALDSFISAVISALTGGKNAESAKPLVIDLSPVSGIGSDGLEFINRFSSNVFYDFTDDTYKERSAWVGPNEGIIFWDKDLNDRAGRNEIILSYDLPGAKTDLHALILAGFDKNNDGIISASEADGITDSDGKADAGKLKIWQDKNTNGIYDPGESKNFSDIVSFIDFKEADFSKLDKDNDGKIDKDQLLQMADGSIIFGVYKVVLAGSGEETKAYDMAFAYDDVGFKETATGIVTCH
ncbi:EF-hand domain-containing protein [Ensifer soli]|uniref:EF-hand domain-containing protein n=1 Tax=Ciceribacter sp. sgz301302 TaxID=3342379 RepID=UPI0035B83AB8